MNPNSPDEKDRIRRLYVKRAQWYDFTANLYYLIGFREWHYRKKAIEALHLRRGDTVVEIGCGTGLNFPMIQGYVGPEGKLIGVDLTDAMLAEADGRVRRNGWKNVELVRSDAAAFPFPGGADGIISTFAITLIPEFDRVIQNGFSALREGKRIVVLDFKMPSGWLSALAPLGAFITRPFGVKMEMAARHPWESIRKYFHNYSLIDCYGGFVYIATGER